MFYQVVLVRNIEYMLRRSLKINIVQHNFSNIGSNHLQYFITKFVFLKRIISKTVIGEGHTYRGKRSFQYVIIFAKMHYYMTA